MCCHSWKSFVVLSLKIELTISIQAHFWLLLGYFCSYSLKRTWGQLEKPSCGSLVSLLGKAVGSMNCKQIGTIKEDSKRILLQGDVMPYKNILESWGHHWICGLINPIGITYSNFQVFQQVSDLRLSRFSVRIRINLYWNEPLIKRQ